MHRSAGLALLLVLALGAGPACNRSDGTPPSRTVREETTTSSTSTTTLEQSYAVPKVIDKAYVNRVLAALDEIHGGVARRVLDTGQLAPEDLVPIRAIYNDPIFPAIAEGLAMLTNEDPAVVHHPPGNRRTSVVRVLTSSSACVHAEVRVDISEVVVDPPPPRPAFLELRPTQVDADPNDMNPTPWSISNEDQEPELRCES